MPQKYISQPSDRLGGTYEVARWNEVANQYETIETKLTEAESIQRAQELNKEYNEDIDELEHQ